MPTNTKLLRHADPQTDTAVPKLYAVVLHNDDYTTMDFVVEVLTRVFRKTPRDAAAMMMRVHEAGSCVVGVYTYDIAATKKLQADLMAEKHSFPLRITISEATE